MKSINSNHVVVIFHKIALFIHPFFNTQNRYLFDEMVLVRRNVIFRVDSLSELSLFIGLKVKFTVVNPSKCL